MRDGWLEDGDVVVLARQALDLLGAEIGLRVDPTASFRPVRSGRPDTRSWTVRPVIAGCAEFGVPVPAGARPVQVLAETMAEVARIRPCVP